MIKIESCSVCGRMFETTGFRTVCPNCIQKDLNDFNLIRDYLYIHPGAKVFEVSNNLDIPVHIIKRYLREGRLEIIEKQNMFLMCEKCGKPICSGTQCDDCKKQAAHGYQSTYSGALSRHPRLSFSVSGGK